MNGYGDRPAKAEILANEAFVRQIERLLARIDADGGLSRSTIR
jgi:hypothetical protein